jgi:hypothetical protein
MLSRFRFVCVTCKTDVGLDSLTPYTLNSGLQVIQRYITDLHTLQFTVTHALGFSVFNSRILATDFITVSLSLQITHEVFFAPPNSFLAISSQSPSTSISRTRPSSWQLTQMNLSSAELSQRLTTTNSNDLLCPFITSQHGPRSKYSLSIVEKTCLLIRCLAMDVLLLCAYASAGMCLPNRSLAMGLYVTIHLKIPSTTFCDVTHCSLLKFHPPFRGTYCLHLQGRRESQENAQP